MVRLTVAQIARSRPAARVGLLASTAVHRVGVYTRAFGDLGLTPILPRRQEELMTLIRAVKGGDTSSRAARELAAVGSELEEHSDITLIACSELSLISAPLAAAVPIVDSLDVLTEAIVDFAAG
jgi:aspartate racemase